MSMNKGSRAAAAVSLAVMMATGAGFAGADTLDTVRDTALTASTATISTGVGTVVGAATGNPGAGAAAGVGAATVVRPALDASTQWTGELIGEFAYGVVSWFSELFF